MKLLRPIFILFLVLGLCSIESEQQYLTKHALKYFGWGSAAVVAAPLALTPALLPVFAVATPFVATSFPKLLFLKLLALKGALLVGTPAIAIGALIAGAGGGILAGKLGTLALLYHLEPLKADYYWCLDHYAHLNHYAPGGYAPGAGWGWGRGRRPGPSAKQILENKFQKLKPIQTYLIFRCYNRLFHQRKRDQSVRLLKKGVRNLNLAAHHVKDTVHLVNHEHRHVADLRPYQGLRFTDAFKGLHHVHPHHVGHHLHHQGPVVVTGHAHGHAHHSHGDAYGPSYTTYGDVTHGSSHSDDFGGHHDDTGSYGHGHGHRHDEVKRYSHSHGHAGTGRSFGYGYDPEVGKSEVRSRSVDSEPAGARASPRKSESVEPMSDIEYIKGVLSSAATPVSDFFFEVYDMVTGGGKDEDGALTPKKKPKRSQYAPAAASAGLKSGNPWEFPGLNAHAAEQFLEQHFEKLKAENPKEAVSMIRILRSAYKQTLTDLGVKGQETVPNFVPMPASEENSTRDATPEWWTEYLKPLDILNLPQHAAPTGQPTRPTEKNIHEILHSIAHNSAHAQAPPQNLEEDVDQSESETETGWEAAMVTVSSEVQQYFMLLSSFDNETCFEKLVCDVHTRINESPENFTPYENNVLAVFKLLKTEFSHSLTDPTSQKYLRAAEFGKKYQSSAQCQVKYPVCRYSTNDVMEMGSNLDDESTFSVKEYLLNKLKLRGVF